MNNLELTYKCETDTTRPFLKSLPVGFEPVEVDDYYISLKEQVRAMQDHCNEEFTKKMQTEGKNDVPEEKPIIL
ncbi:EKC/KEOPS complex subunit Gon7 [Schizosaccharomyces pombe]|uniref:EKC/KEOPS complex subunit gon7 n=1 Tax=Schizosaccharomyces pombe (strain 972 / ATCC 24843) TaxID=284812 RepID=GON7_SCHPO|nr:putative EKC/KEOPS complex subunit Gon7 [Schizosaccharomyces pombe]A6X972.1 RecName: Full=EKC/KEOPS complex subunit gon7 [Schizosaccharomyces pombe 972h-]CAO77639.1 EKC/KEOPS complex subunit Gon7 (predicted) [Schizosaccharomyces pombe]|eukprot:NP_001343032.1 putative EKC/KEOPS complex subunit Gon7 [Schizosaccharomyces pombe]